MPDELRGMQKDAWDTGLKTLASMITGQMMGGRQAVSHRTFISNLRLYADEMEKLLPPKPVPMPDCPVCKGQRELSGTPGIYNCFHCGHVGP
jgi:hypothetical protein